MYSFMFPAVNTNCLALPCSIDNIKHLQCFYASCTMLYIIYIAFIIAIIAACDKD